MYNNYIIILKISLLILHLLFNIVLVVSVGSKQSFLCLSWRWTEAKRWAKLSV